MDVKRASRSGSQVCEKRNLEAGKFDREIACPDGVPMFYRDENCIAIDDGLGEDMRDCAEAAQLVKMSDVMNLARRQPQVTHNPTMAPDPFLNIQILNVLQATQ